MFRSPSLSVLACFATVAGSSLALGDGPEGEPSRAKEGHEVFVAAMAIDHAGARVVTGGPRGRAILWDTRHRKPIGIRDLGVEDQSVTAAVFHPDGKTILLGTSAPDGPSADVVSWRPADDRLRRIESVRRFGVERLLIDAEGTRLITIAGSAIQARFGPSLGEIPRGRIVTVRDLTTGRRLKTLRYAVVEPWFGFGDDGVVFTAEPDRNKLVIRDLLSGAEEKSVALRGVDPDLNETARFYVAPDHGAAVRKLFVRTLIQQYDTWNLDTGQEVGDWTRTVAFQNKPARFSPNGRLLATLFWGPLVVRDVREGRELWSFNAADEPRFTRTPDIDRTFERIGIEAVRDAGTFPEDATIVAAGAKPREVVNYAFSGDGNRIAVLTADGNLFRHTGFVMTVREARTGKVVSSWSIPCRPLDDDE